LQVPIPENLDLDSWINDPPYNSFSKRDLNEPSLEELERRREARKLEQENNPHYLKGSFKTPTSYHNSSNVYEDFENIPVAELDIPISLKISNSHRCRDVDSNHKRHKKHEKKKRSKKNKSNCYINCILRQTCC